MSVKYNIVCECIYNKAAQVLVNTRLLLPSSQRFATRLNPSTNSPYHPNIRQEKDRAQRTLTQQLAYMPAILASTRRHSFAYLDVAT
eukprot:6210216-Pleurochrysis_carterae.AAC.4